MLVQPEVQKLGLEVWEAGIELAVKIGQERLGPLEPRKACFEQTQPEVGCATALHSDSCLESIQNADIVTVVHIVMEVQMFAKRLFQEIFDAVDTDIEVDSTVLIVHQWAAVKCRQGEVTTAFLAAPGNLSDSRALEEPNESSLYQGSAAAGRV